MFTSLLLAVTAVAQSGSFQTGAYVYDGAGNIKSIGAGVYRYDAVGRLVSSSADSLNYTYDNYGNMLSVTAGGSSDTFGVNAQTNRMTDPAASVYAVYDNAGRLLSTPSGSDSFTYDGGDMIMRSSVLVDSNTVTRVHIYSASDERLASLTPGTSERSDWTIRDANGRVLRRIARTNSDWTWKQDYIYAGGSLIASEVDSSQGRLFYFPDHLGSARLITGNGGMKVSEHKYAPFGTETTALKQDLEKLQYTGHERDTPSLDYMHARYYRPQWARFLSVDPKDSAKPPQPQSWNRYAYAVNNPIKYIDPDGRDVWIVVTNQVVGTTHVNSLPNGGGTQEDVPAYKVVMMNEAGNVDISFSGSRDTNYNGDASTTRGDYGSNSEAPPGNYYGKIRTDGKLGNRVEMSDTSTGDTITAPDGTQRQNVQIHIGPGCSQGCVLLTGGKSNRDSFISTLEAMQKKERDAGRTDTIHVVIQPRNKKEGSSDFVEPPPK